MLKKEKILSCDFVRAICALGIIAFHFSCHLSESSFHPFYSFKNGDWGSSIVTCFFVLSGFVLYYNYADKQISLRQYYYKRWKALYPMFYMAYIPFYLKSVLDAKSFFYIGNPHLLILTLLGMDGYFRYKADNYYILGEWFLGAIIMLYLLYPLILWAVKKFNYAVLAVSLVLFVWQLGADLFEIDNFRNLLSCMFSFIVGMFIAKYPIYKSKVTALVSVAVAAVLMFVKLPGYDSIYTHIMGFALFFVLMTVGEYVMKVKWLGTVTKEVSKLSYAIFLVQNVVALHLVNLTNPVGTGKVCIVLLAGIFITIVVAEVLYIIAGFMFKSKPFKWLDTKFLGDMTRNKQLKDSNA